MFFALSIPYLIDLLVGIVCLLWANELYDEEERREQDDVELLPIH